MTADPHSDIVLPSSQVEELIRTLVKGMRAFQMYLPNNPIYHRALGNIRSAFEVIWGATDEIILTVAETDFVWEDAVVYQQVNKSESLAWTLYKDGLRSVTLRRGCEGEEMEQFLLTINAARQLQADASDDLLTLLWEKDFQFIQYHFVDLLVDAAVPAVDPSREGLPSAPAEDVREQVAEEAGQADAAPAKPQGVVDIDDFDSTLYFLDESEIKYVAEEIAAEYTRDLRASCLNAVFDLFELQVAPEVREEIFEILDALFPSLLNAGEFKACAVILREVRVVADRGKGISAEQRAKLAGFVDRLSDPAIVSQLMQALDEGSGRPSEEDLGELLRELRPTALEALVLWSPRLSAAPVRALVERAAEGLAESNAGEVLRLLREHRTDALLGVIGLAGRLRLEPAVPGLGEVLSHSEVPMRLAAVEALDQVASPSALAHLERALGDSDRAVRLAAVKILGNRGYRAALKRVEEVVFGKGLRHLDFNEKRAFFEAYGAIAGAEGLRPLSNLLLKRGWLRRRSADVRMCAALGLGRVGTPEAREALTRAAEDRDRQVRNAVAAALRGVTE